MILVSFTFTLKHPYPYSADFVQSCILLILSQYFNEKKKKRPEKGQPQKKSALLFETE